MRSPTTDIEAAGALVWRPVPGRSPDLVLVHRPKYDDWSFPKGKADPGETPEETALREVWEETGLTVRLGRTLPDTRYVTADGRSKRVRWWAARAREDGGAFEPNHEVDALEWLPAPEARERLTNDRDRELVDALLGGPLTSD